MAKKKTINPNRAMIGLVMMVALVAAIGFMLTSNAGVVLVDEQGNLVGEAKGGKPGSPPSKKTCVDSDEGLDFYMEGYITGPMPKKFDAQDGCVDNVEIREVYCKNNYGAEYYYGCPNGCQDGACLYLNECEEGVTRACLDANSCQGQQTCANGLWSACVSTQYFCDLDCDGTNECSNYPCSPCMECYDTDGGLNYYVQGIVYGYNGTIPYNITDECNGNMTLFEYYCDNGPAGTNYYCLNGCWAGACMY